ncbi:hypothetical protein GGX14DRAFT_386214 [Mycena pura]|uniref:Uncharacterized protein n=1 Tax=Mycena pura TaxID=153505 RepID=A0AAD6YP18_9AGAR|nr:hypothetical protein GGX14DRAFT_386214 [Mycena pura]
MNFDDVGIPLADALVERLGMHIAILVIGPVGDQGGDVRVRSIFSDTSMGEISKMWPEFDHSGFTAAEASLSRYGRALFCETIAKQSCRERVWPSLDVSVPESDGLFTIEPAGGGTASAAAPAPGVVAASGSGTAVAPGVVAASGSGTAVAPARSIAVAPPPNGTAVSSPSRAAAPPPSGTAASASNSAATGPPSAATTSTATALPDAAITSAEGAVVQRPPVDQSDWGSGQKDLYGLMIRKSWGVRWEQLIEAMCDFEASKLWWDDRYLTNLERPHEIGQWMKEHRKAIDYPVDDDFGERLLAWWRACGPEWRRGPRPADVSEDQEWPLQDNTVWGLVWWGQAIMNEHAADGLGGGQIALAQHEQWQYLLGDMLWAYSCITTAPDPEWLAEIEKEQVWAKPQKTEAKKKKTGPNAKKQAQPARQSARGKRRRCQDEDELDEAPPAKKQAPPRPSITKNASGQTNGVEKDAEMAVAPPVTSPRPEQAQGQDDPFAPTFEPFAEDPTARMSAEECADYEAEMAIDPFADDVNIDD